MHWSFSKIPKAKLTCWLAFMPRCSWRPIFPLSLLTAHWATGTGVTVHLNLLYSFILFHGIFFFFFLTCGTPSYHFTILSKSWMSVFVPETWVSLAKREMQVHTCCKGTQSCCLICSFYSSLWVGRSREKGSQRYGEWQRHDSLRGTPYLNSTLHSVLIP